MKNETVSERLSFIFELYKLLQQDNVNYIYRGVFTQKITEHILSLAEANLVSTQESSRIKKKVYNVMVECLQNISKHQAEYRQEVPDYSGIFAIQNKNKQYYITTGNLIQDSDIKSLTRKIDIINGLSKDELKQFYKDRLTAGKISPKGGAGLGLIDMARKSGNKLEYEFKRLNDYFSNFYLKTQIPSELRSSVTFPMSVQNPPKSLSYISEIHKILEKNRILLVFNSIFSQESLMHLLSIVEKQMENEKADYQRKVFNVMVEMIQNIIKHGADYYESDMGKSGVFFLSETDNEFELHTGNFADNKHIERLMGKLDYVNSLDQEGLEEFYTRRLFDFEIDNSKGAGLGFIDIRLKSNDLLKFNFFPLDQQFSFFTFQTSISKN